MVARLAALPLWRHGQPKWAGYALLAVVVHLWALSQLSVNAPGLAMPNVATMTLNIATLAAPAPAQPKQQVTPPVEAPLPERVITRNTAPKAITKAPVTQRQPQPLKRVEPKPIAEKPVEPNPAPSVPERAAANHRGRDASTVIQQAVIRHQVPPVYPPRALERGQQGRVMLHAKLGASGEPKTIRIAQSSGYRLLDRAALAAVEQWKFEPVSGSSRHGGWVSVPVNFVIR